MARPILYALLVAVSTAAPAWADNDLLPLNDEFGNAATVADWSRLHIAENWNAEQLQVYDVNATKPGTLVMEPYTCTWYQNYIGPYAFKTVTGNFVLTTEVHVTNRALPGGDGTPASAYSLGGLMVRTPRTNPATWHNPGGENYVFLSLGHGDNGLQFERKTTVNSVSTLNLFSATAHTALLQWARVGNALIALTKPAGDNWYVVARYNRADMPDTLQAGFVAYSDWSKASTFTTDFQNSNTLTSAVNASSSNQGLAFNPDLIADFNYAHFLRPELPANLVGKDLLNSSLVTDAELIAFLGDNANVVPEPDSLSLVAAAVLVLLLCRIVGAKHLLTHASCE